MIIPSNQATTLSPSDLCFLRTTLQDCYLNDLKLLRSWADPQARIQTLRDERLFKALKIRYIQNSLSALLYYNILVTHAFSAAEIYDHRLVNDLILNLQHLSELYSKHSNSDLSVRKHVPIKISIVTRDDACHRHFHVVVHMNSAHIVLEGSITQKAKTIH